MEIARREVLRVVWVRQAVHPIGVYDCGNEPKAVWSSKFYNYLGTR